MAPVCSLALTEVHVTVDGNRLKPDQVAVDAKAGRLQLSGLSPYVVQDGDSALIVVSMRETAECAALAASQPGVGPCAPPGCPIVLVTSRQALDSAGGFGCSTPGCAAACCTATGPASPMPIFWNANVNVGVTTPSGDLLQASNDDESFTVLVVGDWGTQEGGGDRRYEKPGGAQSVLDFVLKSGDFPEVNAALASGKVTEDQLIDIVYNPYGVAQAAVAAKMAEVAYALNAKAVINTGDSRYQHGCEVDGRAVSRVQERGWGSGSRAAPAAAATGGGCDGRRQRRRRAAVTASTCPTPPSGA